jgi:hypothetical protein
VGPPGDIGTRPQTYVVVPCVLLNRNTGAVTGTPTKSGTYVVTIWATNDSSEFDETGRAQATFEMLVKPTGKRYVSTTANQYLNSVTRWDGQEWVDISNIRKWNGSSWATLDMT